MATARPPGKRACVAGGGELKRLAEIIMVLSGIGTVRASREPSPLESSLVAEAKARLASLCAAARPKDIFPKDAVMALVKDLGLNSSNDRCLRSRPQRMSIAEKFLVSKRKMEESKDLAACPVSQSSIALPVCDGVCPGSQGLSVHESHDLISVLRAASPTSLVEQPQVNEKEAAMATALPGSGASIFSEKVLEITAPSTQLTAAEMVHIVLAKQLPGFNPVQNELAHAVTDEANWTIPSIDYIDKSLNCQICKTAMTDVESLLVCDACERGTHMKCLPSSDNAELTQDEWYCPKCLALSNGRPFVPKYGRVRRFVCAQASSKRKAGNPDSS